MLVQHRDAGSPTHTEVMSTAEHPDEESDAFDAVDVRKRPPVDLTGAQDNFKSEAGKVEALTFLGS